MSDWIIYCASKDGRRVDYNIWTTVPWAADSAIKAMAAVERSISAGSAIHVVAAEPWDYDLMEEIRQFRPRTDWVLRRLQTSLTVRLRDGFSVSSEPTVAVSHEQAVGRTKRPEIPPEVWAKPDKNLDYMSAVRDMCRGGKS